MRTKIFICVMAVFFLSINIASADEPFTADQYTVALFHLDENTGATTSGDNVPDSVVMTGTFQSLGVTTWTSGKFGSGVNVTGVNNSGVSAPATLPLSLRNTHLGESTIEAWVKPTAFNYADSRAGSVVFVGSNTDYMIHFLRLQLNTGNLQYLFGDINKVQYTTTGTAVPADDQWHHIAATRNVVQVSDTTFDVTITLFLDGQFVGYNVFYGIPTPRSQTDFIMDIGTYAKPTATCKWGMIGNVDEVRISNIRRYLAPWEIVNPACFLHPYVGGNPSTAALFHFNENTGSTVYSDPCELVGVFATPIDLNDTNSTEVVWATGKSGEFGSALSFNGNSRVTGVVVKPVNSAVDSVTTGNSTIQAWINIAAYPSERGYITIYSIRQVASNFSLHIRLDGTFEYGFFDSNTPSRKFWLYSDSDAVIPLNEWHHVAATRTIAPNPIDPNRIDVTVNLILDGAIVKSQSFLSILGIYAPGITDGTLSIGCHDMGGWAFNGLIDEVQLSKQLVLPCAGSCEAGVYLPGDLNKDCHVNLLDLAEMAAGWLKCNNANLACE